MKIDETLSSPLDSTKTRLARVVALAQDLVPNLNLAGSFVDLEDELVGVLDSDLDNNIDDLDHVLAADFATNLDNLANPVVDDLHNLEDDHDTLDTKILSYFLTTTNWTTFLLYVVVGSLADPVVNDLEDLEDDPDHLDDVLDTDFDNFHHKSMASISSSILAALSSFLSILT